VKAISFKFQLRLIIADVDKRNFVKKNQVLSRRVWKLKESNIRGRFAKRVGKSYGFVKILQGWSVDSM